ncbi:MAG: allophanate hydrolase subunit 1 [Pseudomonadota bacterium]
MSETGLSPQLRPVGDVGVLVDFADAADKDAIAHKIRALDGGLSASNTAGLVETIPALTSLLVRYDPLETEFETCATAIRDHLSASARPRSAGEVWRVPVCYDESFAPDLSELSERVGIAPSDIIDTHSNSTYRVGMYGFAPGYAYLTGVPRALQIPRKTTAVRGVPAGSVMIAGGQCLISTLTLPTGWWVIGRAAFTPLDADADKPFAFEIGDEIHFEPVDADKLASLQA